MGFLNKIFGKKEIQYFKDFSMIGTDLHSHFAPAIDDGSQSVEDSIEMITELHKMGYKKFITTPHIMSDYYPNTRERIEGALETLKEGIQKEGLPVEISAAAEYYMDYEFRLKIEKEPLMTFGDNYVLVEFSFYNKPEHLEEVIFELQTAGYQPVLAHVERYVYFHKDFERYEKIKDTGVYYQLNMNSLTDYYSPNVRKIAEQLVEKDMINFIGTDCHRMEHVLNYPKILKSKSFKKLIDSGLLLNETL